MRVTCENCGASYKIPEHKLVKEVNKATCRKCGHRMLIRRGGEADGATQAMDENPYLAAVGADDFRAAVAAAAAAVPRMEAAPRSEWEEEDPTHLAQLDENGEPIPPPQIPPAPATYQTASRSAAPVVPSPVAPSPVVPSAAAARPAPAPAIPASPAVAPSPAPRHSPPPVAIHSPAPAPVVAPAIPVPLPPPTVAHSAQPAPAPVVGASAAFDPSGDLGLVGFGAVVAAVGGLLLAVNPDGGLGLRLLALFLALWGSLTALFVVVTGSRGRRKASLVLSTVLGTLFALIGAGAVIGASEGSRALEALARGLETPPAEPAPVAAAPLGNLFAEEPATAATAAAPPPEAARDAQPAKEPEPARPPEPAKTPEPAKAPEPVAAREPSPPKESTSRTTASVDRESAYVAPPSEPARGSSSASSSSAASSTARSSGSTSGGATSGSASGASSSTAAASTATSSASSASTGTASARPAMSSLPPTVVDTMVKSNQAVKKCMYQEYKRSEGNLGSVTVRFKVLNTGKVSSASVLTSRYKDTELDTCMTAALYSVVFPAFEGEAQSFDITLGA